MCQHTDLPLPPRGPRSDSSSGFPFNKSSGRTSTGRGPPNPGERDYIKIQTRALNLYRINYNMKVLTL